MTVPTAAKSMRQEFADTLLSLGQQDEKLVVLIGDISHFILQPFAVACPGRFYNIGICEPATVNMAAGLAKVGLYPVVHTITPFIVERSFEQIKLDFGYQELGVNLVTVGSAFDYASLGCTHHSYGDFALLKTIPNTNLFYPASPNEFLRLFSQVYQNGQINYFRLPEAQHGVAFKAADIKPGRAIRVKTGLDITLVATGPQLRTVMAAASLLGNKGYSPEVLYIHTVRPLDVAAIRRSVRKTGRCLVVEEHGSYGSLFDDILRCTHDIAAVRYDSINIGTEFIHEYGSYEQHCQRLGFTPKNVVKKALRLMRKK